MEVIDDFSINDTFKERFETKEHCAALAVDFVTSWLDKKMLKRKYVNNLYTIADLISIFRKMGYKINCYCSAMFLLNPILLLIVLLSHCTQKKSADVRKYAIVHFSSARYFYGINALWNHYIVEAHDNDIILIYDSYFRNIKDDYPGMACERLKTSNLNNIKSFKIVVWKE